MIKVKITGIPEIDRALRELEPKLAKKAIRRGMRAGLKIMLRRARDLAPVGESFVRKDGRVHEGGLLRKKIKIVASRSRKAIRLSIMIGQKMFTGDAWYGAAVNEGTKRIKARKFLQQAFEETKDQVRETTSGAILDEIESIKAKGK